MGVIHFMGVGRSVGVVTCAIDYLEKALSLVESGNSSEELSSLFSRSGGVNHKDLKGKIEAIVLFTSKEVIQGQITAFPYKGRENPTNVRAEIVANLRKIWKQIDPDLERKIFWCELEVDDFQDCFNKIVQIGFRFCPPGKQGKEIWCNLTGGINSIALALFSMAQLTGSSTKHYLISQQKEFKNEIVVPSAIKICPNKDGYFNVVPYLKTKIDTEKFYEILLLLEDINSPIKTEELLSRLKSRSLFLDTELDVFKKSYMLKLYGLGYTHFDIDSNHVSLTEEGRIFVQEMKDLETVCSFEEIMNAKDKNFVEESKNWSWFRELDIL